MEKKVAELKQRLQEIQDLQYAAAVLNWDQATYMPSGGAAGRGRQLALLGRLAHERQIDPALGNLLEALVPYAESLPEDAEVRHLIRIARRDYEEAVKIPSEWVAAYHAHSAHAYDTWTRARPADDFAAMEPLLEKTLDLSRELANFFPGYDHIADPLIDFSDYGMKAETIRNIFSDLRQGLVPLVQAIAAQPVVDDSCLRVTFPEAEQLAFGLDIIRDFGFDFERGRQDKTHHPFMTKFSMGDFRITTRVTGDYLGDALFSTLHEGGHALYEMGIDPAFEGTPLASGCSAGLHESQSRLWENVVGRSYGFWSHYYPSLQERFTAQLGDVSLDAFYRAINKVEPSLIRVDADEVTYNLHIMVRFDLELELLEGKLAIRDLPEAWRARYKSDLGVVVPDDKDGVLQDVHWYDGLIGGSFQGYTLGNIMCGMFYAQALQAHPEIETEIAAGKFGTLHKWLRENIYQHGRKYDPNDLVESVTGGPLDSQPYIEYLTQKYRAIYDL